MLWYLVFLFYILFFFFKQKTAYEMRISDWSSDVCSSDLGLGEAQADALHLPVADVRGEVHLFDSHVFDRALAANLQQQVNDAFSTHANDVPGEPGRFHLARPDRIGRLRAACLAEARARDVNRELAVRQRFVAPAHLPRKRSVE